jgi:uncharacterized protein GlcG (DUF336 family)/quercetin dioxygenase-like cupin family protein
VTGRAHDIGSVADTQPTPVRAEDGWHSVDIRFLLPEEVALAAPFAPFRASFPPGAEHRGHTHPKADEFVFVISGWAAMGAGEEEREVGPGTVQLVPAGTVHWLRNLDAREPVEVLGGYLGARSLADAGYQLAGTAPLPPAAPLPATRAIPLSVAQQIVAAAMSHGAALGLSPLTVAVLDPGGHIVCLQRQDDSGILRPDIAVAKAWGVLGMGLPSRQLQERADHLPNFFAALTVLAGGRMVPVPGGVPIRDSNGALLGAVGVTGDTSANDEACAVHGVQAVGLSAWLE